MAGFPVQRRKLVGCVLLGCGGLGRRGWIVGGLAQYSRNGSIPDADNFHCLSASRNPVFPVLHDPTGGAAMIETYDPALVQAFFNSRLGLHQSTDFRGVLYAPDRPDDAPIFMDDIAVAVAY